MLLKKKKIKFSEHSNFEEIVDEVDILYSTRIQKERFPDVTDYEKVKNAFILEKKHFNNVKKNFKIMHPLPRVNEIKQEVDDLPYAYYFQQAGNGIPIRQALLALVTGELK